MAENMSLERMERRAWRLYFQDGVMDMFLGLVWLGLGLVPLVETGTDVTRFMGYILALVPAYAVFVLGKRYITTPRLGVVRFGARRKSRTFRATLALAASVVFGLVVMFLVIAKVIVLASDAQIASVAFGANVIIVFAALAYFLDFNRLYAYGPLFASSILVVEVTRGLLGTTFNVLIGFGVPSAIVVLIGAVYAVRFVRAYPLPAGDGSSGV